MASTPDEWDCTCDDGVIKGVCHKVCVAVMKQAFLCINHRINKGVDLNVDSAVLLFLFVSEDVVGVSAGHGDQHSGLFLNYQRNTRITRVL